MRTVLRPLDWMLILLALIGIVAHCVAIYLSYQDSHWLPVCNAIGSVGLFACALLMFRAVFLRISQERERQNTKSH